MRTALLKEIREAKSITLEQLSEAVDISVSQLSRFESGKRRPRVDELEAIADSLGVGAWVFLDKQPPTADVISAGIPPSEVRVVIETLGRRLNMSDNAVKEVEELFLEEMLGPQSPVLDQRTAELRVAFDRIVRRFLPKASS